MAVTVTSTLADVEWRKCEDLNASIGERTELELKVSLCYGRAEHKQKQKVTMTKLIKPEKEVQRN